MKLWELTIGFEDHPCPFRNFVFAKTESEAWEQGERLMAIMRRESEFHSFLPDEAEQ